MLCKATYKGHAKKLCLTSLRTYKLCTMFQRSDMQTAVEVLRCHTKFSTHICSTNTSMFYIHSTCIHRTVILHYDDLQGSLGYYRTRVDLAGSREKSPTLFDRMHQGKCIGIRVANPERKPDYKCIKATCKWCRVSTGAHFTHGCLVIMIHIWVRITPFGAGHMNSFGRK